MTPKPLPTQDALRALLTYDPLTGVFRWRQTLGQRAKRGAVAGHLNAATKYWRIKLYGVAYVAHRLAWRWMTGDEPFLVDHKNGDPADNRWNNLRAATKAENSANTAPSKRNTSGFKGVSARSDRATYVANIRVNGKLKYLGDFKTPEEAAAAYQAAARKYFGEFAATRLPAPASPRTIS